MSKTWEHYHHAARHHERAAYHYKEAAKYDQAERAHACQDGIGKVEYRLEGLETKCSDREGSGKTGGSR